MKNPPSFQFYPQDFLSDLNVLSMNDEQVGKYTKLLCSCWIEDGLEIGSPLVDQWFKSHPILRRCFVEKGGKYRNPRLDKERQKQINWQEKSSRGGETTQKKRWGDIEKLSRNERIKIAKSKGSHTEKEWLILVDFCGNKCVRCGASVNDLYGGKLCKDHIIPICLGGNDSIKNIQPVCRNCNTAKTNSQEDLRPKGWESCLTIYATKGQPKVNQRSTLQSSSSSSTSIKNIYPPLFEEFWKLYPRKEAKEDAHAAFKAVLKEASFDDIKAALVAYRVKIDQKGTTEDYIQHAATFLRKNRWRDHLPGPKMTKEEYDSARAAAEKE
ncbi:MAG: HNH endonuclease [Chloroflexi bacterium]|nr:HNH endonuclease [Chloroflexota bacterium]